MPAQRIEPQDRKVHSFELRFLSRHPPAHWSGFLFLAWLFIWMFPCLGMKSAESPETDGKPNILFIMADDVGVEVLGCYGGESYATPNLDRLARTGMRFNYCFSMPVCHPTRVALMTGRYPFRFGTRWGDFPNEAASETVGPLMQQASYATAVAGKWQLTLLRNNPQHPHPLGFDEYALFGWHEGPRYWQPLIWQNGKIREDVQSRYGPEVYTDFLIDFMERNQNRPFFAYYSMALCHDVTDDLDAPVPFGPGKDRYDSYAEMVTNMDRMVGRLINALDRMGLREKTLILFTTDNGTPQRSIAGVRNGRLYREPVTSQRGGWTIPGGKGTLKNTGTLVPLIANQPGVVPEGKVIDDLVDIADFLPTLAELGGATLPEHVTYDGYSFAHRLRREGEPVRTWVFSQGNQQAFVRNQRWKLYDDGRLVDLASDPMEAAPILPFADGPEAARARLQLNRSFEKTGWPVQ